MAKPYPHKIPLALRLLRLLFKVFTPIAPKLMGRLAYNLWITPPRPPAHPVETMIAKKAMVRYIWVDGLRVKVWTWGQGPTVLFIHGWGGRGTQIASFVHDLNKAGYQVVSFDMPAHGQSDGKRTNAFSIAKATTAILQQIENLHSVITHSFGGVVFAYCYKSQSSLKKVIMLCPPSTINTAFDQFIQTLELPQSIQKFILNELNQRFGTDVFERLSLLKNGAHINQPVLVIHDKEDQIVPAQDSKDVVEILQQGTYHETAGLGHIKILYDKAVIHFIQKYVSGKASNVDI